MVVERKDGLIVTWHTTHSWIKAFFFKSQVLTTNADLSKFLLPGNILFPFRVYRSGRILKNGVACTCTLHVHLHRMVAVRCVLPLETHYEKSEKVEEGSTGMQPVPARIPVSILFGQTVSQGPCKNQLAHANGVI